MVSYEYSLGLMSGSSLDGLDICYSHILEENGVYSYKIISFRTVAFPTDLLNRLKICRELSPSELITLDADLGKWIGEECWKFIKEHRIIFLDFIASHGHTVFHFPEKFLSKQIGCAQTISNITGYPVITNFREKDILAGGQGAPIVPIGDLLLFPHVKYCLNLGGIMNISIKEQDKIFSFDLGVCNQVINHYALQIGLSFDKNGHLARAGVVDRSVFDLLNADPFFHLPYPKSLDNSFSLRIIEILDESRLSLENKLRTFYEHVVFQINRYLIDKESILITGGGTHNIFLLELIKAKGLNLAPHDHTLIDNKEALVMSMLGKRFLENKFNVLASVTGAKFNTVCGDLHNPFSS